MQSFIIRRVLISTFFLLISLTAYAQQPADSASAEEETQLGLALSGGGAKGFAHIGVLKVLEEEGIPIHVVSGTSMGAIVGSLYAIGYTPEEIEQIALTSDWEILFNDNYRINPKNIASSISTKDTYWFTFPFNNNKINLPTGLIDGQNISMMLYRLMLPYHNVDDFTKLPIPFAAVATDLATGEGHSFTQGYLPNVVRASAAIPTIFKPVKVGDSIYIDGGIARNIPVEDSYKLGADLVIASDVGEPVKPVDSLNTFVDILFQSVGFHQQESNKKQIELSDFYIRPDIKEFSTFSYDQARAIIKRGEEAARKALPKIRARLDRKSLAPDRFKPISTARSDHMLISEVSFSNISGLLERQTELALNIQTPTVLSLGNIETKINRLYNSNLYRQISYRLRDKPEQGKHLIFEFRQKEQEYAGFSVRYDSQYRAALLFGLSLTNNFMEGDRLTNRLRIGEIVELSSHYRIPMTLAPLSHANFELHFQRSPIDFYNRQQALSTVEVEQITLRNYLSVNLWEGLSIESGVEAELYNLDEAVGNTLVLEDTRFLLKPFFQLQYHTLNRPYFPTSGQSLQIKASVSSSRLGSATSFRQLSGSWKSALPLLKGVTFQNTLTGGYTSGADIPLHYNYYLGGIVQNPVFDVHQYPFMGHPAQQLRTTNLWALDSELQFKLSKSLFLKAGFNAAHLSDKWTLNLDPDRMKYGYSLSIGGNTLIGPVELSLSTPDLYGGYAAKIDIGYHF